MESGRCALLAVVYVLAYPQLGASAEEVPETNTVADPISSAFESTVVKISAKPGEREITVVWDFTNRWNIPLLVERFEESCGCLSGLADKNEVAPGASGKILAVFAPGGYRGMVRKSLHVRFAGFDKAVELVAEVTIPSAVEISTRELVWKNKDASLQTVDVKAGTDSDFTITGLAGVSERLFTLKQETVTPGRHYRITITPAATTTPSVECLQIRTDSADLRDRVLAVFLHTEAQTETASPVTIPSP